MRKILILGANSAIARAYARREAEGGASLFLVSRSASKLAATVDDLKVRAGAEGRVFGEAADLTDVSRHEALIAAATGRLGGLDVVLVAHGELGDQKAAERDFGVAAQILTTNFLSPVSLLSSLANHFETQKHGTLAVITSVAGDRGRQSNYVYGTSKGALSIFLAGLRHRLWRAGVSVVDLKLGFVDTPMTAELPKGPLWAKPDAVARGIQRAIARRCSVAYVPWFWRYIMLIVRNVPERLFLRTKL
jgi:NAD(P)-dependent dehydrogenase (short-subunit alcohol dehydrogenase family)